MKANLNVTNSANIRSENYGIIITEMKMSNLADTRELIQNDIICCVESNNEIVQRFPDLLDNLCQIVVDRFKEIEDER